MRPSILRTLALAGFSLCLTVSGRGEEAMIWVEYPDSGVVLGQGYDLLEDRPSTGTCVDFVPIQDPSQSIQYRFDEVTSQTQVQSITNVSASGSMKMAILKATARLSFLSDESFRLETQKFLLSANVVNSSLFAAPSVDYKRGGAVVLQPGGAQNNNKDYASYSKIALVNDIDIYNVEKCGQGFVAAIVSGASLDAFLTMSKTDAKSLSDIKGGLEADIGGIFTVSGSFQQKQTSASIQQNTSVSVYKTGGTSSKIAYDLAGLKASIAAMPLEAATAPKPIRIGILPYDRLDSVPDQKSYSAQLYGDAVAAYFLARDVFQRTGSVIDAYEGYSEAPAAGQPIYRKDLSTYLGLNARAIKSANQLSRILELCQEEVARANDEIAPPESGVSADSNLSTFASALGSAPPSETSRGARRALVDRGTLDLKLDAEFLAVVEALRSDSTAIQPLVKTDPVGTGSERLAMCSANKSGGYLDMAVTEALALAADELKVRPIFWSELGLKYQEELRPVIAKVGGNETVAVMTDEATPSLDEFSKMYRASRLIRDTCQKAFSHPLCSVDYIEFLAKAELDIKEGDLRFGQLKFDGEK